MPRSGRRTPYVRNAEATLAARLQQFSSTLRYRYETAPLGGFWIYECDDHVALVGQKRIVESGWTLDIQIKSTTNALVDDAHVAYDLDINAYDDLRDVRVQTPRILVLHVQPDAEAARIQHREEALKFAGCCYWHSLKGFPASDNKSTLRIQLPRARQFSPDQLRAIMTSVRQRKLQ